MYRNHFIVAIRNFRKKKAFTAINILGLTIGMTVALLILTYARYEMSYDRFHSRAEQIYRVSVDLLEEGNFQVADAQCYPAVGKLALENFPEIEDFAMARYTGRMLLKNGQTAYNEDRLYFANPGWLSVFDWHMISGDPKEALAKPDQVVLTESTAFKYFGNEDPLGKFLKLSPGGGEISVMVTGIIKDVPENAHLHFDVLLSWETGVKYMGWKYDEWNQNNEFVYLLTNQPRLSDDFEERFNKTFYEQTEYEADEELLRVYPLTDVHLKSDRTYEAEANGSQRMVNILLMVAAFVLTIAWVNYINLATARAMERGKEVGVRKVLGSTKKSLVFQFMTEALLINLVAAVLTLTSIQGALPLFNNVAGTQLSFDLFADPVLLTQLVGVFVLGALASGIYPSLVLSNYKPLLVLTGKLKSSGKGLLLRKSLVIFQFAATMLLLVGTITVYKQVNYMRSYDLGVNVDQTVVVRTPVMAANGRNLNDMRLTFKNELKRLPQITEVTFSDSMLGENENSMSSTTGMEAVSTGMGEDILVHYHFVDEAYVPAFDINMLAGRSFDSTLDLMAEDDLGFFHVLLINETARKIFGFATNEDAVNQKVQFGQFQYTIVGVMEDYNHSSAKTKVYPLAIQFDDVGARSNYMAIKVNGSDNPGEHYKATLKEIETVYREIYTDSDFDFYFLDERFNKQYNADQQFGLVFSIFSGLSVLISVLGLFGLGLYEIQQRVKEIGIRKVLGASVPGIVKLLSGHFLKLIAISVLVALPLAYLGVDRWLDGYANRIGLSWVLFIVPAIAILFIALLTVLGQTLKVARQNPVESLRYE